jgi:hypothetical protein
MFWAAGAFPPGTMEKEACPATSPKNAVPVDATVRVTGTVMLGVPAEYSANMI